TPITSSGAPVAGTSCVQTISGSPTGGTFRLGYNGLYTAALAYNLINLNLDNAIETLTGVGTVTVGGGPLPAATTLTFGGALGAVPVPLLTLDASGLTGGTYTIANTTPGVSATARGAAQGGLLRVTSTG